MMTGRANDKVLGEWKVRMRRTLNAILKELIQLAVQPIKGFLVKNNRHGMITLEIKMWSRRHLYSSCPSISPPPAKKKNFCCLSSHTPRKPFQQYKKGDREGMPAMRIRM